ncbi:patatin [Halalkalibaculum sp. DA3122]|uniref:patatin n=1 Tax=unclassified Halalkalibaculum TaxID=2964617 RepID=UPI003754039D
MAYRNYLKLILKIIALVTVASGLVQMFIPDFVLGIIGGEITASTLHFFGIVGMFMVFFGGLLFHALSVNRPLPVAILWCGFQKFGAAVAVGLGVGRGLFSWLALGVAGFDLLSGVLIMIHWYSIKNR